MRPQELVERALALSTADECIVIASEVGHANLRWAGNTLTTNGSTRTRDLTVVALVGPSAGVVSQSSVPDDAVADLVARAEKAARESVPAEDAAPLVTAPAAADWEAPGAEVSMHEFDSFAPALGEAFRAAGNDRLLYGYAEHEVQTVWVGSSAGLRARHEQPASRAELTARSPDGSRSAWAGQAGRGFADIDVAALESDVVRRLEWSRRQLELAPGRYDTLLPPSAMADLMVDLYWSAGALDAHEGRTVFSRPGGGTRVGEQISDLPVSLRSDPAMPGQECAPFAIAGASSRLTSVYDNGLPLAPTDWIADGRLAALLQTRHSAAVTGLAVTPWVDNLVLECPVTGGSIDDLVAATGDGLLLTCLWYIREVDPETLLLTGLTRDGAFRVENGEVTGAVNNFRFNESPVDLLRRLTDATPSTATVGREMGDYFTRTVMPAVRVPDFNMSSVSPAS